MIVAEFGMLEERRRLSRLQNVTTALTIAMLAGSIYGTSVGGSAVASALQTITPVLILGSIWTTRSSLRTSARSAAITEKFMALMAPELDQQIDVQLEWMESRERITARGYAELRDKTTALYQSRVRSLDTRADRQCRFLHRGLAATGRWFAANRGRAVSLVTLGHNAGEAVFPFAFVAVAAALGWRNAWLVAAAVLVIVALPAIAALTARERSPQSDAPDATAIAPRDWTRGEVLCDPLFWVLLTGVLAPPFIGTTIFFHQVYLVELRDWSLPVFASSFAVMSVTTIVFVLIAGALIDRFSATALLPVFLVPLSLACLALGLLDAQWSAFVFMALLGVSYGFSSTLFGAIWPEIYGTRQLGAIRAVIVAMMVFATAVGPGLTGALIDLGVSYPLQIVAMGVYCAGVAIVMTGASRRLLARRRAHVLANQPTVP